MRVGTLALVAFVALVGCDLASAHEPTCRIEVTEAGGSEICLHEEHPETDVLEYCQPDRDVGGAWTCEPWKSGSFSRFVERVPGGWIYVYGRGAGGAGVSAVFVPEGE